MEIFFNTFQPYSEPGIQFYLVFLMSKNGRIEHLKSSTLRYFSSK